MATEYFRLNTPARAEVRHYVPPNPAHWDLSKLAGKWYWRALAWCLRKLGGELRDTVPAAWPMESVVIEHERLLKMIERSKTALELLWEKKATTLVIGYDQMEELQSEIAREQRFIPHEMAVFDMCMPMGYSRRREYPYPPELISDTRKLRVVLVPWLSGWALLPDLSDGSTYKINESI